MLKQILAGAGWLIVLLGVCGHFWHKWLRDDAPGAGLATGDSVPVSAYVREHAIWWGLTVVGATIVLVFSRKTKSSKPDSG
jgi:hypothetical protein